MYHRGLSTLGCAELGLDAVLALGAKHGVACFELRALGGTLDLAGHLARECGTPADFAERVAKANARVGALDTSVKLIGGTAADRAALLDLAPWADAAGARWLRVFDGGAVLDDTALREASATLTWWREIRRERGIAAEVMIETHDLLLDAERIGRFVAAMPEGRVPLLWDAHHTWKKGGEDPLRTWAAIRPHVVHVHVKDSLRRAAAAGAFTYVLPGTGEFPMPRLRRVLAREFDGVVSLEWEKFWHPALPPLDEALAAAKTNDWW